MRIDLEGAAHYADGQYRAACPHCNRSSRDEAVSVKVEAGRVVWFCHRCQASGSHGQITPGARARPLEAAAPKRWSDKAEFVWCKAKRLDGNDPGSRYLLKRGCRLPAGGDVRYLEPTERFQYPALLSRVTDAVSAEPLTLHFTYLQPDGSGKAPIECSKRLMQGHQKRGGVIRLWPDESVDTRLAIAEGIETALTVAHAVTPVWSCVDADGIKSLPVLAGIKIISIYLDADRAGRTAANTCALRWHKAGRKVFSAEPPSGDWNDYAGELKA